MVSAAEIESLSKNLVSLMDDMEKKFMKFLKEEYIVAWKNHYVAETPKAMKQRNKWISLYQGAIRNSAREFVCSVLEDDCLDNEEKLKNLSDPEPFHIKEFIEEDFPELHELACEYCVPKDCGNH